MTQNSVFKKEKAKILYGVAVLLMLYHHLFLDQSRLHFSYINVFPNGIEQKLAWFGKICVAIYAFISGYGLISTYKTDFDFLQSLRRIILFYIKYWLVLIISLPLIYFFEAEGSFTFLDILYLFFGLSYKYNSAWWYIREYLFFLFLVPFVSFSLNSKKWTKLLLPVFLLFIFCTYAFPAVKPIGKFMESIQLQRIYILIFIEGALVNKYDLFDIINKKLNIFGKNSNLYFSVIILFLCIFLRVILCDSPGFNKVDVLIIAPFIYSVCIIIDYLPNTLNNLLAIIGKYNTYIWLIHIFFCYHFCSFFIKWGGVQLLYILTLLLFLFLYPQSFLFLKDIF